MQATGVIDTETAGPVSLTDRDRTDEGVVAPGDEHDRGVESLCVGEAR